MGLMDKAKQAMKGRSEMLEKGIDTAVNQVNKRTQGKYGDTLSKRAQDLKARTRQLDADRTDRPGGHDGPDVPPSG